MQTDPQYQEFCRRLAADAAARTLWNIREILADPALKDETCFQRIEAMVTLLEDMGISCGPRHDF